MASSVASTREPVTNSDGLVGISFTPYGEQLDPEMRVLVTLRLEGEQDFSILMDVDTETNKPRLIERDVNAEDYLDGATFLGGRLEIEKRNWLRQIPIVAFIVFVGAILVAGVTNLFSARVVLTGSMVPAINPGDVIFVVNDDVKSPQIGDVVVYEGQRFDGTRVASFAHRIIEGSETEGWVVKGDANPAADTQRPTSIEIEGVVVGSLPGIGRVLTPQFLVLIGIVLFGGWLVLDGARKDS
jgi:signal peptidase I